MSGPKPIAPNTPIEPLEPRLRSDTPDVPQIPDDISENDVAEGPPDMDPSDTQTDTESQDSSDIPHPSDSDKDSAGNSAVGNRSELVSPIYTEEEIAVSTISDDDDLGTAVSQDRSSAPRNTQTQTVFWLTVPLCVAALGLFVLSIIYPDIVGMVIRAGTTIVFLIFALFIVLGIFIIFGLRKEAQTLLSLLFEGGVKYIDIAEHVSTLWERCVVLIKEMILAISPLLAVFLAILFYYLIMFSFRAIGVRSDITLFTIILTVILASITALLGQVSVNGTSNDTSFNAEFRKRFGRYFIDGVEIAVLVIFLTIDVEKLFFLPASLHGSIEAHAFGVDFMQRGFQSDAFPYTVKIAGVAVCIEIIRKIYRIITSGRFHYQRLKTEVEIRGIPIRTIQQTFEIIRHAARRAFKDSIDDMTKFLGFTTILVVAFFFFPVLKMLSLMCFNLANLSWDIIFSNRLTNNSSSEDLFSRILVKVLRLDTPLP